VDLQSLSAAAARLDGIFGNPVATKGTDPECLAAAVRHFERTAGHVRVATIANAAGLSLRQFQRRFREAVGISPKLFSRMQRFQRVFRAAEALDTDWVGAAVRNGYFDQAHLIRDFREFAGKAPTSLLDGEVDLARRFLRSGCCMSHFSNT